MEATKKKAKIKTDEIEKMACKNEAELHFTCHFKLHVI